jgi:hypothetical protein
MTKTYFLLQKAAQNIVWYSCDNSTHILSTNDGCFKKIAPEIFTIY